MRVLGLAQAVLGARGGVLAMLQTVIAQGLTMAVNVGTGIITARLLGATGRGEFAAASFWLLLPSLLATAGLQNAVIYRVRQAPVAAGGIGAAALASATTVFIPLALVSLWLLPGIMHAYPADIVALGQAALLLSVLNVWMVMVRQWLLATRRFVVANTMIYGTAMTYLGLLIVLMALHAVTPASATYAQIGSTGLALLAAMPVLAASLRHTAVRRIWPHLRPLVSYGARAAPIDIVTVMSQNIDRLMLVMLIPAAEFGMYVVALSFARILSVLQTAVSAVMLSDLADRSLPEVANFTGACFRLLLWTLVLACAAVLVVDRSLLGLVYGRGFEAAVPVFRILLADAALSCLSQVLIQAFLARNASGVASSIQVISFGVTAAGVLALAPVLGSIGAACALAAGSLLRLTMLLLALRRIGIALPGVVPQRADLEPLLRRLRRPAASLS